MPNQLFDTGREGILDTTIAMTGDVRTMLVLSSYTFSAAHKFVSELGAVDNGRSLALGTKTYTGGVFNAASTTLTATAATASKALVLFLHTGLDTTARLIAYVDTPLSGLPFTPAAGQAVNVTWDTGVNKIFKL